MNNLNLPDRIKTYLNGTMAANESRQFEAELETDWALKKAFVAYSIAHNAPLSPTAQRSRELVDSVYNTLPSFPTPSLPLAFRLKMWLQPMRHKLLLSFIFLTALAFFFWPKSDMDIGHIISSNSIPAVCKGVAGESLSPRQIFERASNIYCGHEMESETLEELLQLSASQDSFCMADYYLAHWYLKNGRYDEAVPMFEACLASRAIIEAYQETAESRNSLMLNAVLAQFGKDRNAGSAMAALEALEASAKAGSEVSRKIAALKKVLAKQ